MGWNAMRTCLAALLAVAVAPRAHADSDKDKISITTLSTHADRVSGGNVLVEISLSRPPKHGELVVSLNGRDVTSSFRETAAGTFVGLVNGLSLGENRLVAEAKGAGHESLRLVN